MRKKPDRLDPSQQQRKPMQQSPKKRKDNKAKGANKPQVERLISTRKWYGREEDVYIMDAKTR